MRLLGSRAHRQGGPPLHPGLRRSRVLTSSVMGRSSTALTATTTKVMDDSR